MSPDEKYMLPNFNNMNFHPFLNELGLKNLTMGWIPVFFSSGSMQSIMTPPQMPQEFTQAPPMTQTPPTTGMTTTAEPSLQYQGYMNSLPMNGLNNIDQSNSTMMQALRDFDLDFDEENDLSRVPPNRVDQILMEIERNNPGAFSLLQTYKIPSPIIKLIVRRIIRLTLDYCKDNR